MLFQLLILISGNYGFFNLLTLTLALVLLDDALLLRFLPSLSRIHPREAPPREVSRRAWPTTVVVGLLLVLNVVEVVPPRRMDSWHTAILNHAAPFRAVNRYGLFAVMTTVRIEIELQGSMDGVEWKSYQFLWKPEPLDLPGHWLIGHMPRLDWQMWFAALSDVRHNPWFVLFVNKLFLNSPPVTALLKENPFAAEPPRYIRAVRWRYQFTDLAEKEQSGVYWSRKPEGLYLPSVTKDVFDAS